ncbi:MAG TPA: hypothetical protein VM010_02220, partial [Chitinophagaceae bacterium]|nr:hypothetical protein [Chitinophagaceae bacterium]
TTLPNESTYYKIAGTSTAISAKRFTHTDNRFTYFGRRPIVARMFVVVGGKAPANSVDFTIAIAKNGVIIPYPNASMGSMTNNQGYQITMESEVDLVTGDYVELFIRRNNTVVTSLTVTDFQFRIRD